MAELTLLCAHGRTHAALAVAPAAVLPLNCNQLVPCASPRTAARARKVQEQFGNAMGADDFMQRVEMALYAFGFNGDNSIGACGGWLGAALAGGWVLPKW